MIGVFDFPSSLKHEIERYITYVKPYQLHSSLHNVKPLITIISSYYILRTVKIFTSCKKYKKKLYFQHYNLTRLYANTFPLSLQCCRNYSIRLRYFFAFINICFHLWLTVSFFLFFSNSISTICFYGMSSFKDRFICSQSFF